MVLWFDKAFGDAMQLDGDCLRAEADQPISHDNLFHSMLGLADVTTKTRTPALDLTSACRTHEAG
jgi:lipid A ethanolaminephosphotransferase